MAQQPHNLSSEELELGAGHCIAVSCTRECSAVCMLHVMHAGGAMVVGTGADLMSRMQMMAMLPDTFPLP
eukprot:12885075-Prorocentrum_lima.AAC.1